MHPILFKIGPITVYSYGVLIAAAFLTAGAFVLRDSHKYGLEKNIVWDLLLCILISGIAGARLLHVLLNLDHYAESPVEILLLHRGGLAIHGAIITAIAAAVVFLLKKRLPLWKTADLVMLYLPLGQSIGRVGCYLNGCCYGKDGHPTQIYLSLSLLTIFFILRRLTAQKRRFDGEIFLTDFLLYAPARFFIDFLRADLVAGPSGLTASQVAGVALFTAALLIYVFKAAKR